MKLVIGLILFAVAVKIVLVLVPIVDAALGCTAMCGI